MSNPVPAWICAEVAEKAVRYARQNIQRRNWSVKAQNSLSAYSSEGKVGIRTSLKYLQYQNDGVRPFLMTALEGKTVPIKGHLYRVSGVGLPGMGWQDRQNNPIKGPVWRDQRWRYPGIKPKNFIGNSISRAILESRPMIRQEMNRRLNGEVER